ncbi:TM2 domain-containing protein [Curtobacterium sp. MCSS17_016]|uniref:TM2 domain-containing protein n=1 Tax=Curtobacterium sp. MCSS17_016 TaxID=2175644 RepID=UPI000DA79BB6|nr:TM2 domain-containing protein [Curtobacterium sp. MCSS17_016]WIE81133.1 TM2 domain-containing protein [Curtobacterium sp. MCSS17_016]
MTTIDPTQPATQAPAAPAYSNGRPQKHIGTAYKWLIFFGAIGAHRYYQGKVGTGILYTCTAGLFGIGLLVDIFTLDGQVVETNQRNNVAPTSR